MVQPIYLAMLWHQHQPLYKDILRGRYVLPWVRLHAIKDYIGMLLTLKEFPEVRCTVNLVPSLIVQLEEYAAGLAEDEALRLTRKPAEDLTEAERLYVLDQFFGGNAEKMIQPVPRYAELLGKRRLKTHNPAQVLRDFSPADLRDLQVWGTLAWFHPLVVQGEPVLKELRAKGRDFTDADKAAMLQRQDAVLRRVVPLHKEMADFGQIELSTTPFYHPILPLLCNMESAREGLPGLPMPDKRSDFRPDAEVQVVRAFELHQRVFGRAPTGVWPAEGSVGMDILPLLAGRGLKWIATDEGVLARSAEVNLTRDQSASLVEPDGLYQPYALPGDGVKAIVFRDRVMSDSVGFEYHRGDNRAGAENLVWRITEAGRRCNGGARLVSLILDGENPWDYYDEGGLVFLREFYGRLSREKAISTMRLSDYVDAHPPQRRLGRLHAGSWINANFSIWIGAPEDRAAWSLVAEAREALLARMRRDPPLDADALARAWEEIYVAEGSDWCWWLGGEHTSEQDYMFDELFRSHLANVYILAGEPVPAVLQKPLGKPPRNAPHTGPQDHLRVTLDGRVTDFHEWAPAGHYSPARANAAMRRGVEDPVSELYYGFDAGRFLLRLDSPSGDLSAHSEDIQVRVRVTRPAQVTFLSDAFSETQAALTREDTGAEAGEMSAGKVAELAVPLGVLAARPGDTVEFVVEIVRAGAVVQRVPDEGAITAEVRP